MPSFAFVLHRARKLLGEKASVSRLRGKYLVDPRGDLAGTSASLAPLIKKLKTSYRWDGIIGASPKKDEFLQLVSHPGIFLYSGHGSAEEFLRRERLGKLNCCATALLIGCSSGRPKFMGRFEPSGIIQSGYLLGGSCAVVANLWDVTDADIDRFTLALLKEWMADEGKSLAEAVSGARSSCKLGYLVGAAPVCFGVPVVLSKE